jgi:spore germination protein KA
MNTFNKLFRKIGKIKGNIQEDETVNINATDNLTGLVSSDITKNRLSIQQIFSNSIDLQFEMFETYSGVEVMLAYLGEIVDKKSLDQEVMQPLMKESKKISNELNNYQVADIKKMVAITDIRACNRIKDIADGLLEGCSILFFERQEKAFIIDKSKWQMRQIEEPPSESVIKGPKEGFIENIQINRSLVRRKIKSINLIFERFIIGKETNTEINIGYIKGTVNEDVLIEVRERLNKININAILDAGNIEELIEDSNISPIETIGSTEKPDVVSAKILEGRVAIFCDGSPHVLTVPHVFIETIHSAEDYYIRPYIATFLRLVRLGALIISMTLPALYVALTTYHQDMIPTVLLRTMKGASEGIPLPAVAEAILMTVFFEFLKESGTRLPKAVGSAISIVGALVLGDAGVQAGIVSAPMVLITAFTAVCSFIVNALTETITLYRLILLILAGIFGLYGLTVGGFMMIIHASSLRSFGVPYLSPIIPIQADGLKDFILRFPIRGLYNSPFFSTHKHKGK